MAKTKEPHIKRSAWKRLRGFFTRVRRNITSCFSVQVEDQSMGPYLQVQPVVLSQEQEKLEVEAPALKILKIQRQILRTTSGPWVLYDRCPCGGWGEHSLRPCRSDTAANVEDVNPGPSSSAHVLKKAESAESDNGLPDCRSSILGDFSQTDIPTRRDTSALRGTQCTTMSFVAIIVSSVLPVGLWTSSTVNKVLRLGDRLHHYLIEGERIGPPSHYLAADEMPRRPRDETHIWPVECSVSQEFQGLIHPDPTDISTLQNQLTWEMFPGQPMRELSDALRRCLAGDVNGCIITLNNRSSAVFRHPVEGYEVFDSHAKNCVGGLEWDGKATLLRFPSLTQLVAYFRFAADEETQYSLTGFKVECSS